MLYHEGVLLQHMVLCEAPVLTSRMCYQAVWSESKVELDEENVSIEGTTLPQIFLVSYKFFPSTVLK